MTLITHYLNHKGNGIHFDRNKCLTHTYTHKNAHKTHQKQQMSAKPKSKMHKRTSNIHTLLSRAQSCEQMTAYCTFT